MPTTCGFPNCKFRSRYRGADDNRHFYRVPKKPPVLRERWLQAIGRTEDTIVNQEIPTNPSSSSSSTSQPPFVHVVVHCDDDARTLATSSSTSPSSDYASKRIVCFLVKTAQIPSRTRVVVKITKTIFKKRRKTHQRKNCKTVQIEFRNIRNSMFNRRETKKTDALQ